ncbi:MAG: efflux RND transporter periplasmic adaptor subunit [Paracoccaceae bacterium]
MALLVIAGLAWWFVGRHEIGMDIGADGAAVPGAGAGTTAAAEAGARDGAQPVRVMVIDSRAVPTTETLRLRGRTEADRTVTVSAETSGLIASDSLPAGTRVEAGETLCRLDPGSREAERREARAKLEEARAEAEAAESLSRQGFAAETTRRTRRAALEAARATLERIELDIARLEIEAPFGGTLTEDTPSKGAQLAVGQTCAEIVDLSTLEIVAFVSERQVDRLREGQTVRVRLVNGVTREGTIRDIADMADVDTRTYRVEARVDNADRALRDGMTAEIVVDLDAGRAHELPQSVLTLDDGGRLGVRLVEDGRAAFAPVRLLRDTGDKAWLAGLPGEARVIAVGQEFVREGRAVEAVPYDQAMAGLSPEAESFRSGPGSPGNENDESARE